MTAEGGLWLVSVLLVAWAAFRAGREAERATRAGAQRAAEDRLRARIMSGD